MVTIVNIASFDTVIWTFLWENAHAFNVTFALHDATELFIHNGIMSSSGFSQIDTQKS